MNDENSFTLILLILALIIIVVMAVEKVSAEHKARAKIQFTFEDLPLILQPKQTTLNHEIVIGSNDSEVTEKPNFFKHPLRIHVLNNFANGMRNFGGKLKRIIKSKTPINSLFCATNTAAKSIIGLNPIYIQPSNFFIYTHISDQFESYLTVKERNGEKPIFSLFIL